VELRVTPIYDTALRHVDTLIATLKQPDGTYIPIPLSSNFDEGGTEDYLGTIPGAAMPFYGVYEVRVMMMTGPNTFNDPGEAIWEDAPKTPLRCRRWCGRQWSISS